jgi:alanine dehydrogenase
VSRHEEIFERAELIVKVKEPLPAEYGLLRPGQILSPTCTSPRANRSPMHS